MPTEPDPTAVWDDLVAEPWIRLSDVVDAHSEAFGEAALRALDPLAGATVLDVGCGLGATTRRLGELVGPDGAVTGVDASAPFVAAARTRGGPPNVSYVHGDATTVELPPVDAVFSRFGVMFFPDPVAAFSHLRELTRPGGRLAFACWQAPPANPWMLEPVMAAASVLGPPDLPPPGAPGPFSLADPEVVHAVLDGAGWSSVETDGLEVVQPYPAGDARSTAEVIVQLAPPLANPLREAPDQRDAVITAIAEAVAPRERDGVVHFEAAVWIVSARNAA